MQNVQVAIVDDHALFRSGIASLLREFNGYEVMFEAGNGIELIEKIREHLIPAVILLDINMPEMDGFQTALWMKEHHPQVKIIILSMYQDEEKVLTLLRAGVKGYLLKNAKPTEFRIALDTVSQSQTYFPSFITDYLVKNLNDESSPAVPIELNEQELEFMRLVASELTYKEISERLNITFRSTDSLRAELFEKLGVKSRTGLVIYAVKKKLIEF